MSGQLRRQRDGVGAEKNLEQTGRNPLAGKRGFSTDRTEVHAVRKFLPRLTDDRRSALQSPEMSGAMTTTAGCWLLIPDPIVIGGAKSEDLTGSAVTRERICLTFAVRNAA